MCSFDLYIFTDLQCIFCCVHACMHELAALSYVVTMIYDEMCSFDFY